MTSTPRHVPFQTDVRRTRGLQAGQILSLSSRPATPSTPTTKRTAAAAASSTTAPSDTPADGTHDAASLAEEESRLNKKIDEYVKSLETSFTDLVSSMSIQDKSTARLELEGFMADYRADVMVRSVQGLSRLSKALRLSLLLSIGQQNRVDGQHEEKHERQALQQDIQRHQQQAALILNRLMGGSSSQGETIRDDQDDINETRDEQPSMQPMMHSAQQPHATETRTIEEQQPHELLPTQTPDSNLPPQDNITPPEQASQ